MELRSLSRKNTIIALNSKASLEQKSQNNLKSEHKIIEIPQLNCSYKSHHAFQYLRGTYPTNDQFKRFATLLYKSLQYSVKTIKQPTQSELQRKKIRLHQPQNVSHKKILFMDLDQTLIHLLKVGSDKIQTYDVKLTNSKGEFHINIRPHCFQFLKNMSKLYNIYIFTAGVDIYAQMVVNYLNKDERTILGFCHRSNCIQRGTNCFIKDLRIIENRQLKDIVIVDNLIHSFGLQIENGIPILQFKDHKGDTELIGLQQLLVEIAKVNDVRPYLKKKLALRKILQFSEKLYVKVQNYFSA